MKKDDTRHDSASENESSGSDGAALAAVAALMEERRRYEGWIASLDARRATTPEHVFLRVHADYTTRLDAVIAQLTTHAAGLRHEIELLSNRLSALLDERQLAEDERSEAELRAHVGELSAEDWEKTAAASDAQLAAIAERHNGLELDLSRTQEMLDAAERPSASDPSGPKATSVPEPPAAEEPSPAAASPEPVAATAAEAPPAELPVAATAAEQRSLGIEEPQTAAPALKSAAVGGRPSAAFTAAPQPASSTRPSKFDELAFLSSVVDTPSGTFEPPPSDQPDEKERLDSFARRSSEDAVVNLTESGNVPLIRPTMGFQKEGDAILADAVGKASISGRHTAADGAKSLKCAECGSMNYPTEWYCERCGAELASL